VQADPSSGGSEFARGLLDPDSPVPPEVKGGSARRFGVYRNNVTVSLVRTMESNFPVVRRLLGEEYFAGFAREFVQKNPPRSPLLFQYGADFSGYLEADSDLKEYPYLSDIARLEQQMRLSYYEEDAAVLTANDLTQISEEDLMDATFTPHPATAIIESRFAIHDIYRANRGEETGSVDNVLQPQAVLVTRPLLEVQQHVLTPPQLVFFNAIVAGQMLGDAAELAFTSSEDFDLASAISLMLSSGAVRTVHQKV
jgi:hypothetical protein